MKKLNFKASANLSLRSTFPLLVAVIGVILCEWCARGSLTVQVLDEFFFPHLPSYLLAAMLLLVVYILVDALTRCAPLAVLFTGILACVPGTVNYYMLQLRGEPFLPWALSQIDEAGDVLGTAGIVVQPSMKWSAGIVLVLMALSFVLYRKRDRWSLKKRLLRIGAAVAVLMVLVFGVFLSPTVSRLCGIYPDAWMQDRYYRWYGVITGFMTNLQNLEIDRPDGYSEAAVEQLLEHTENNAPIVPLYPDSYAAQTDTPVQTPTIIYVMDESYWDVSELTEYGVVFDTDVSSNLHRLQAESAFGRIYSPSFGGGTCDVEFEALTGYSVSHLPSGSKPFQQHVTQQMFSLPNYLKAQGYRTTAIHCFYRKYWSRSTAYPYLGMDEFISLEDMPGAEKVRSYEWKSGLVTDAEMGRRIIAEYEAMKQQSASPVFLHAVTMQNHTNYNAANYPDEQRVRVLQAPAGLSASTIGALEDFATGVKAADELLGALTDYFSAVDEPVILVFWGDHYNPIGSGYDVYTTTGYAGSSSFDPALRQPTLLIWSNYHSGAVDLGTIGTYQVSPVMMELYGLKKPVYFEYLIQQLRYGYRSRTAGYTVHLDGTVSENLTDEQLQWYNNHWLLQYDLMFGEEYALDDDREKAPGCTHPGAFSLPIC